VVKDTRASVGWRLQFLLLSATWGSSFLFIKVLGRHWPAVWIALGRVGLGAITLVVLTLWRRERLRLEPRLVLHLVVAALLFNAIPFTLFAYGEKHVSSIVAGLWNATTPLWVLVTILLAFGEEHPSRERIAGLGVGFAGVAMLLGPWRGLGHGELVGHLACAGAALCYGVGFPYTRRYLASRADSGVALSAGQLVCATVLLALIAPFVTAPSTDIGLDGLGSILALGVLGSGIAYALNYSIVRAAGSAVASMVTYVIPIFSTLLGVVVLGESLSWNQPVGALVLLLGIAISDSRLRFGRRPVLT
jgi:drug/metabolite transporter (DMT)-like permease